MRTIKKAGHMAPPFLHSYAALSQLPVVVLLDEVPELLELLLLEELLVLDETLVMLDIGIVALPS
mgnify:CR=1 FL=1